MTYHHFSPSYIPNQCQVRSALQFVACGLVMSYGELDNQDEGSVMMMSMLLTEVLNLFSFLRFLILDCPPFSYSPNSFHLVASQVVQSYTFILCFFLVAPIRSSYIPLIPGTSSCITIIFYISIILFNHLFSVSRTSKITCNLRFKNRRLVVNEANGEAEQGITSISDPFIYILFYFNLLILIYLISTSLVSLSLVFFFAFRICIIFNFFNFFNFN